MENRTTGLGCNMILWYLSFEVFGSRVRNEFMVRGKLPSEEGKYIVYTTETPAQPPSPPMFNHLHSFKPTKQNEFIVNIPHCLLICKRNRLYTQYIAIFLSESFPSVPGNTSDILDDLHITITP